MEAWQADKLYAACLEARAEGYTPVPWQDVRLAGQAVLPAGGAPAQGQHPGVGDLAIVAGSQIGLSNADIDAFIDGFDAKGGDRQGQRAYQYGTAFRHLFCPGRG